MITDIMFNYVAIKLLRVGANSFKVGGILYHLIFSTQRKSKLREDKTGNTLAKNKVDVCCNILSSKIQ